MWLFTPDGFYSAVQHKDDPDKIMVRTRAKKHAERLVLALPEGERPPVMETPPPADYRWRVTLTRGQWVYLVAKFAAEIAYGNFKNEAHKREHPSGFMPALHRVWGNLMDFQDDLHADTRKSRWGRGESLGSLHAPHTPKRSTSGSNEFADLDEWLGRSRSRQTLPAWSDPNDEDEYEDENSLVGMAVRLEDDQDLGVGYVKSVSAGGKTAVVVFTQELADGTEDIDELEVRVDDLLFVIDPDVAEEMAEEVCASSRPEVDEYDAPEDLAEEDDGSWPPPRLGGFLRGR